MATFLSLLKLGTPNKPISTVLIGFTFPVPLPSCLLSVQFPSFFETHVSIQLFLDFPQHDHKILALLHWLVHLWSDSFQFTSKIRNAITLIQCSVTNYAPRWTILNSWNFFLWTQINSSRTIFTLVLFCFLKGKEWAIMNLRCLPLHNWRLSLFHLWSIVEIFSLHWIF